MFLFKMYLFIMENFTKQGTSLLILKVLIYLYILVGKRYEQKFILMLELENRLVR